MIRMSLSWFQEEAGAAEGRPRRPAGAQRLRACLHALQSAVLAARGGGGLGRPDRTRLGSRSGSGRRSGFLCRQSHGDRRTLPLSRPLIVMVMGDSDPCLGRVGGAAGVVARPDRELPSAAAAGGRGLRADAAGAGGRGRRGRRRGGGGRLRGPHHSLSEHPGRGRGPAHHQRGPGHQVRAAAASDSS